MKIKVYDTNLNDYITMTLSDDFVKKTMLITLPNENNEIIELPKDKITYEFLILCIRGEFDNFETMVNKFKIRDFLEITNVGSTLLHEISTHDDFDPSKLGFLIPLIIDSKFLNEKNSVKLRKFIGYEFEDDKTKFRRLNSLFKHIHTTIRSLYRATDEVDGLNMYLPEHKDSTFNSFCEEYSNDFPDSYNDSYKLLISIFEYVTIDEYYWVCHMLMRERNIIFCNSIVGNHVLYNKIRNIKLPNVNIYKLDTVENLNLHDDNKINICCTNINNCSLLSIEKYKKVIGCSQKSNFEA